MITQIISGGGTGVERAALDVAIKMGIRHGGWVGKNALDEDGILPGKYNLKQTDATGHLPPAEKNVTAADGILLITDGPLSGTTDLITVLAKKRSKPVLHVDLRRQAAFVASRRIVEWLTDNQIQKLYVSGTTAASNDAIYAAAASVLEAALFLGMMDSGVSNSLERPGHQLTSDEPPPLPPVTIEEGVERLVSELSLKDKATIANLTEEELPALQPSLGDFIRRNYEILSGNLSLIQSCRAFTQTDGLKPEEVPALIIHELWKQLQQTHKLRRVK